MSGMIQAEFRDLFIAEQRDAITAAIGLPPWAVWGTPRIDEGDPGVERGSSG